MSAPSQAAVKKVWPPSPRTLSSLCRQNHKNHLTNWPIPRLLLGGTKSRPQVVTSAVVMAAIPPPPSTHCPLIWHYVRNSCMHAGNFSPCLIWCTITTTRAIISMQQFLSLIHDWTAAHSLWFLWCISQLFTSSVQCVPWSDSRSRVTARNGRARKEQVLCL